MLTISMLLILPLPYLNSRGLTGKQNLYYFEFLTLLKFFRRLITDYTVINCLFIIQMARLIFLACQKKVHCKLR